MKLERGFYIRDSQTVARELLGKVLVHDTKDGITKGRIVETEAYGGITDKASHAYGGRRTRRTEIQYGPGGFLYMFLIHGRYSCMDIVTGEAEKPGTVLLRALEPLEGISLMKTRRKTNQIKNLCSGPGKLCSAMGIDQTLYGADLCGDEIYIEDDGMKMKAGNIAATRRIHIDRAGEARDFLWRFILEDSEFLSG